MGRKCFVPNCTSGYDSNKETVSIFKAPNNPELLEKWRRAIPRADKLLNSKDFVCANHFPKGTVITRWTSTFNGKVIHDIKIRPRLQKNAIPSIFPNGPTYLSKNTRNVQKSPALRKVKKIYLAPALTVSNDCQIEPINVDNEELTFKRLRGEAGKLNLPNESWGVHLSVENSERYVSFCNLKCYKELFICKNVIIGENLNWHLEIYGKPVDASSIDNLPHTLRTYTDIELLIKTMHNLPICSGGPHRTVSVYCESAYIDKTDVWRHKKCKLVVKSGNTQCVMCGVL